MPVWCAHMGTLTFHPWPVRRADVDRPDELRIDLDPQPGTTSPTRSGSPGSRASCSRSSGSSASRRPRGNRGVHVYVRIEPRWEFVDVRHAAIGFGRELERRDAGVTTAWWKEERGRADLRRLQPELPRPHHRLGVLPAPDPRRAGLHADDLGRAGRRSPTRRDYNLFTVPERLADGDPWAGIDDTRPLARAAAGRSTRSSGRGELPYPPDYPKMPGEPPRVQPSRRIP